MNSACEGTINLTVETVQRYKKRSVQVVGRKFCDVIHKHLHMHVTLDKPAGRPRMVSTTWPVQLLQFLRPEAHFFAWVLVLRPLQTILGRPTSRGWSLNYPSDICITSHQCTGQTRLLANLKTRLLKKIYIYFQVCECEEFKTTLLFFKQYMCISVSTVCDMIKL